MDSIYWIEEWARIRKDEVVRLPKVINIHESYLKAITKNNFIDAFIEIWNMFIKIYHDIEINPHLFKMPLYKLEDFYCFSNQARESRNAPYQPFIFLYTLLNTGNFINDVFIIDVNKFKSINKIRNINILFARLSEYGFSFSGLYDNKLIDDNFSIYYYSNENLIPVLKIMANKAYINNRINDFLCCHYKLFQDDINTINYGFNFDIVADKMHTKEEQDFIYKFDETLRNLGYFSKSKEWNEGPAYAYYDKESVMKNNGPFHYLLLSYKTKLVLYLRIRNASKCLEYLKLCPDSVKEMFLMNDSGCKNRINGTCKFGQEYQIDGNTYWRCGCATAPFYIKPKINDINHYIKLVEIGAKKSK